jgi:hypothetical protein
MTAKCYKQDVNGTKSQTDSDRHALLVRVQERPYRLVADGLISSAAFQGLIFTAPMGDDDPPTMFKNVRTVKGELPQ